MWSRVKLLCIRNRNCERSGGCSCTVPCPCPCRLKYGATRAKPYMRKPASCLRADLSSRETFTRRTLYRTNLVDRATGTGPSSRSCPWPRSGNRAAPHRARCAGARWWTGRRTGRPSRSRVRKPPKEGMMTVLSCGVCGGAAAPAPLPHCLRETRQADVHVAAATHANAMAVLRALRRYFEAPALDKARLHIPSCWPFPSIPGRESRTYLPEGPPTDGNKSITVKGQCVQALSHAQAHSKRVPGQSARTVTWTVPAPSSS